MVKNIFFQVYTCLIIEYEFFKGEVFTKIARQTGELKVASLFCRAFRKLRAFEKFLHNNEATTYKSKKKLVTETSFFWRFKKVF